MRDNAVEELLSLFTSADRAEAIAGDLAQEREQHGWIWFLFYTTGLLAAAPLLIGGVIARRRLILCPTPLERHQ